MFRFPTSAQLLRYVIRLPKMVFKVLKSVADAKLLSSDAISNAVANVVLAVKFAAAGIEIV